MRFNSVIGAFVFIVIASVVAFITFVQTHSFGKLASRIITEISEKKFKTAVAIDSVNISVFPPGLELNRVQIRKKISKEEELKAELGKLGFYIGLLEIEERKLTLGEVRMANSVINYQYFDKESKKEVQEIDRSLIEKIFSYNSHLPLRLDTVLLENTKIFTNGDLVDAKRLKIVKKGKSFVTKFHLANLRPVADKGSIDEIWGDLEIGKNDLKIQRLKVVHDVHSFLVKGEIKDYPLLTKSKMSLTGETSVFLRALSNTVELPEMIELQDGSLDAKFSLNLLDEKLSGSIGFKLDNLKSNFVYADNLVGSLNLEENKIVLNSLQLKYKKQNLSLIQPVQIADFNTKTFLNQPIDVKAENIHLSNALRFLGPTMKPLKGKLSGMLTFSYKNGDFYFYPKDEFLVRDLALLVGEDNFSIIHIKNAWLNNSQFTVVDGEFQMHSRIKLKSSSLEVVGKVNSKNVDFETISADVDLEDFGNISQLDIKGKGKLDVKVSGPLKKTIIEVQGKTKEFEVLGYKLGSVTKDVKIDLYRSNVVIRKMEARNGYTYLSGNGEVNYGNSEIALGITSRQANFTDLKNILSPIFSKINFLPEDLDFNAKIDTDIFGKYELPQLKIKSRVKFDDLNVYDETLNTGNLTIGLDKQVLNFTHFYAEKRQGRIYGNFFLDLAKDYLKLGINWDNISLSDFNFTKKLKLNLDSKMHGSLEGEGPLNNYLIALTNRLNDTHSQSNKFEDSAVVMKMTPKNIFGEANIFGDILKTSFDYSFKKDRDSRLNLAIDMPDIKPYAVAFLGQHLQPEAIAGSLKFKVESLFDSDLQDISLKAILSQFQFEHESLKINYAANQPQFLIEGNVIKKWDLDISDKDLHLDIDGKGKFGKKVTLSHDVKINSKILELLLEPVLSSEGFLENKIQVDIDSNDYNISFNSSATDLDLSLDAVPFPLNNIKYNLDFSNRRLRIDDFSTNLENGTVSLKGDVYFDDNEPDVNIKYVLDRAEIPVLGKSVLNLSGEGIILGNNFPYNLGGEVLINKAIIINELDEFGSKSSPLGQIRFLPKNQESTADKIINLNLNVKAENPIRITNSLMDIGLRGELILTGSPTRPRADGRLYSPINASRVFFKNNEYFITNADLNFSPKKDVANPDFDIQALTYISSYKITAKAYGDLERFNFDLTSDPNLSRNSILSLIAFGYTDEIQSNLTQGEQQNLTQMGVGSFVFDRFKISDILNKQFGLQVNLGTVFEQSQTDSLLAGRSQEGQGTVGRVRSATKIELKKRLDDALSLSVSSTMGGSIGQRQSMNLNYSVNKKVQLEGVYELRTNAEGEEDIIDNSIGADLKFRWTFK